MVPWEDGSNASKTAHHFQYDSHKQTETKQGMLDELIARCEADIIAKAELKKRNDDAIAKKKRQICTFKTEIASYQSEIVCLEKNYFRKATARIRIEELHTAMMTLCSIIELLQIEIAFLERENVNAASDVNTSDKMLRTLKYMKQNSQGKNIHEILGTGDGSPYQSAE